MRVLKEIRDITSVTDHEEDFNKIIFKHFNIEEQKVLLEQLGDLGDMVNELKSLVNEELLLRVKVKVIRDGDGDKR